MDRDTPITYGALIDALRSTSESISKDNRYNDDEISRRAKSEDEDLVRNIAGILEQHIEEATDDANVRDMRRAEVGRALIGAEKRPRRLNVTEIRTTTVQLERGLRNAADAIRQVHAPGLGRKEIGPVVEGLRVDLCVLIASLNELQGRL